MIWWPQPMILQSQNLFIFVANAVMYLHGSYLTASNSDTNMPCIVYCVYNCICCIGILRHLTFCKTAVTLRLFAKILNVLTFLQKVWKMDQYIFAIRPTSYCEIHFVPVYAC